jgi:hypothetical protein
MATSKAETNRKNALHSTGPKTSAGKAAAVSKNAVTHGAYSEALTMLLETPESFATLRAGMVESFRPVGPMEENLVDRMASLWWRMERAKMVANQSLWMNARRHFKGSLEDMLEMDPFNMDPFNKATALDQDECRFPGAWDHDKQERFLRLLSEIAARTGFTDAFTHVSDSATRTSDMSPRRLCAALLAGACNTGLGAPGAPRSACASARATRLDQPELCPGGDAYAQQPQAGGSPEPTFLGPRLGWRRSGLG